VPGIGTAIGAGVGAIVGRRKMNKEKKEQEAEGKTQPTSHSADPDTARTAGRP